MLAEQSSPCLALLDLGRGRAYQIELPRGRDCGVGNPDAPVPLPSFLASIEKAGLAVRCGATHDDEAESEDAARRAGKELAPWPLRLSWKQIETAAARMASPP